ncbi:hypothetical protein BW897_31430 [Bacillus cereus]|uniref:Uncharacterized protein n=1 Tax=Bacillus cereus TaxID=1396 RepID=A0A1S9T685_BACCE|nr:Mur ligase family protein [Bacillus cereus]OOR05440.1 hypothetical protein BW897_31430 [Bacillus cereus]
MKRRPVIAINGSAGKSTTKEMISSILNTKWRIYKSKGNYNSFTVTRRHRKKLKNFHQAARIWYGQKREHSQTLQGA